MNKTILFGTISFLIILIGGILVWQLWYSPVAPPIPSACTQEAKLCPDGSSVSRIGPNCEFAECPNKNNDDEEAYNHAGEIVKIYQKEGKEYLDINFIKFLLFVDENNNIVDYPTIVYGENDEEGECKPIADPYCVVDNDKTINSHEVGKNVVVTPASYPGTPLPYENLEELIGSSPYFRFQIENNIIKKINQIYIP
ncbi:hypothetical protein KKC63_03380 [Patescibacteria group bacterium]|nr:hypothetical protein [Patescibacteria group bacterium]MBU4023282.1 hypothetical protein [Patescibacteria group bacterium]